MGVYITKEDFANIRDGLKAENKIIGLCHGVYDLVHPGHITHFEEAKKKCDILVVSLTCEKYVRKGPGRPYFNDETRSKFLTSLNMIDYVILSEGYTADDVINVVKPDFYIKGMEYAKAEDDVTGKIEAETELVQALGGKIYFTPGAVFSSTKLLNNNFSTITPEVKEWAKKFTAKYSAKAVRNNIESLKKIKVLVLGDVIIDDYVFCKINGLMSKDRGYSTTYDYQERYLGGSLAIARHMAQFSDSVTLMSAIGNEPDIHSLILNNLSKNMKVNLEYFNNLNTIIKKRYIVENKKRETIEKLYSVNTLPDKKEFLGIVENTMLAELNNIINDYDAVVICDFGHGLLTPEIMKLAQEKAKYLALNVQTNSTNYGYNLITKYKKADLLVADQRELHLALANNVDEDKELFVHLWQKFNQQTGFLTRGAHGAIGIDDTGELFVCPAFTLDIKDTVGAGDAFFAAASLCGVNKIDVEETLFISSIFAALATNIIGNKEPVSKVNTLKYINTILNV